MSENLENSIDNNLLLQYNKKCQQGADGGSDKQPPKDKKKFLKKEVFKMTRERDQEIKQMLKEEKMRERKRVEEIKKFIPIDVVMSKGTEELKAALEDVRKLKFNYLSYEFELFTYTVGRFGAVLVFAVKKAIKELIQEELECREK